jgi:hypothetical protein
MAHSWTFLIFHESSWPQGPVFKLKVNFLFQTCNSIVSLAYVAASHENLLNHDSAESHSSTYLSLLERLLEYAPTGDPDAISMRLRV